MRERHDVSRPPFVADWDSVSRDTGHTMDWDAVPDSFKLPDGRKHVPAGTRVGFNGADGRMYPRVVTDNPAKAILATPATEGSTSENRSSYGVILGGVIYENLLPGATGTPKVIPTAEKTELAAAGTGFAFVQYRDSTV